MRHWISWVCVFVGLATIFGGCFMSIALRNPGGEQSEEIAS
ncbi:MAG: hypothetical protein WD069_11560 [Planctomycetales bacterium]